MNPIKKVFLVIWLILYLLMIFIFQTEEFFWSVYLLSLIVIFFWTEKNKLIPVIMTTLIPVIEAVWMIVYFGIDDFVPNMEQFSTFCRPAEWLGVWPTYILLCIILPLISRKFSKIFLEK